MTNLPIGLLMLSLLSFAVYMKIISKYINELILPGSQGKSGLKLISGRDKIISNLQFQICFRVVSTSPWVSFRMTEEMGGACREITLISSGPRQAALFLGP